MERVGATGKPTPIATIVSRLTSRTVRSLIPSNTPEQPQGMSPKHYPTFRDAVADIPDGATVAFGGFGMPGTPFNLIKALAERLRAAGAGIPAFYTPTAVGTELAEGRETRVINGREYLLEYALPVDYAFLRAHRADAFGNLQFHRSQRNFNPLMAMAARVAIVEVDEDILPIGAIDPDQVHTPGIFIHRLVKIPPPPDGIWPVRRQERRQ